MSLICVTFKSLLTEEIKPFESGQPDFDQNI
jgi:hypothetical protein